MTQLALGWFRVALACAPVVGAAQPLLAQEPGAAAQDQEEQTLPGIDGPTLADLGSVAQIQVPQGFHFLAADDARKLLEQMGNPSSQRELGMVMHMQDDWFVVFEYDDGGHVKDDEKDELDADEILKSLRKGNDAANEERKRRGWTTLEILGWVQEPHYDEATKNLEWATRARSEEGEVVNLNTRLLGRVGVTEVTLVCDGDKLTAVLPEFRSFLRGFEYKAGQKYAEYRAGDKLAEYGLTALVAGGAGVLAAKTGLLAKLWKVLVVGAIAVGAFVKRLFGRKAKASPEA